jgi:hypothetical protein
MAKENLFAPGGFFGPDPGAGGVESPLQPQQSNFKPHNQQQPMPMQNIHAPPGNMQAGGFPLQHQLPPGYQPHPHQINPVSKTLATQNKTKQTLIQLQQKNIPGQMPFFPSNLFAHDAPPKEPVVGAVSAADLESKILLSQADPSKFSRKTPKPKISTKNNFK